MTPVWLVASVIVGLLHFAIIVAVIVGGPLALRWPKLARLHLLVAVAVGGVFAVGADCPLTTWQKWCLRRADRTPYDGGFIEHYLITPITGDGMTTAAKVTVAAIWIVPTVISYSLMWRRTKSGPPAVPRAVG